jgi:tetratricopeptide (TPR) repeat protein
MASSSPSGPNPTRLRDEILAGQRHASVSDLADDVSSFLDHSPFLRGRPWARAAKWTKRCPALAGMFAVATTALVVLALVQLHHLLALEATAEQAHFDECFDQLKQARATFDQFAQYRGDAVFHWNLATFFASDDAPSHMAEIRKAAIKALALVDQRGDARTAAGLSPYWNQREKEEVLAGSHQLLLMLADATANPGTTQPIASRRESLKAGLGILDRAAKAFPPTQPLHLCRARYLSQLGDEAKAHFESHMAAEVPPYRFGDHVLAGLEQCQRGETKVAAQSFQIALAQQPADFWSRCFLALCQLKLNHPAQAQANLTRCIAQRPDFMWSHLLRGLAYSGLNAFGTAEFDFAAALKIGSDSDVKYAAHLSRGLMRLRQNKRDAAIADLEEAIALKPEYLEARMTLAKLHHTETALVKSN